MSNGYYETIVAKTRKREWFCDIWKPIKSFMEMKYQDEEKLETDFFNRNVVYDTINDRLKDFENKHFGTKWAYAYHNRGITDGSTVNISGVPVKLDLKLDPKMHEYCEHIHFVIRTENAISGSSLMKHFPYAHIDFSRNGITACANYLLHNTASSQNKHRVPKDDLYCSGSGEHGVIWFPLINSHTYETFIPDNILHYVYNENMHSMLDFIVRFGHIVCNSNYRASIEESMKIYNNGDFINSHVKEVFELLPEHQKLLIISRCCDVGIVDASSLTFDSITRLSESDRRMFFDFEKIYIWWKCCTYPANTSIRMLLSCNELNYLLEVDRDRQEYLEESEAWLNS